MDQSGHCDFHDERATHPPQDVQVDQSGDFDLDGGDDGDGGDGDGGGGGDVDVEDGDGGGGVGRHIIGSVRSSLRLDIDFDIENLYWYEY